MITRSIYSASMTPANSGSLTARLAAYTTGAALPHRAITEIARGVIPITNQPRTLLP